MKISLEGLRIKLTSISQSDAQDLVTLRNDKNFNRFLSNRDKVISLEEQLDWMKKLENNFDFKISFKHDSRFCGSIALYDIVTDPQSKTTQAEFGRYIATNAISAVESEYLILKFGFDVLGLDRIYCNTDKENEKVWKQHLKFGFKTIGEDVDSRINVKRVMQEIHFNDFKEYDFSFIDKLLSNVSL